MRIAVITCEAYRDAWKPFTGLFQKFWPHCPYPAKFYSDLPGESWCSVVARCAREAGDDPVLMLLEDFFLSAPVHPELIEHGLRLMQFLNPGCVRIYPMPGGLNDFGDKYYAVVPKETPNRISCQAAIWRPSYLLNVVEHSMKTTSEAGDFENLGSPYSDTLPEPVLAFKREVTPWPIEYLASAISRGLWNPDAITLCAEHGIELDRSMRSVEA